jgi:hypothetical protein
MGYETILQMWIRKHVTIGCPVLSKIADPAFSVDLDPTFQLDMNLTKVLSGS